MVGLKLHACTILAILICNATSASRHHPATSSECYSSNSKILGEIDKTVLFRHPTDFIVAGGLYLLPCFVSMNAKVKHMCVFGSVNPDYSDLILTSDGLSLDFNSNARPFVHMLLFRAGNDNEDTFELVYKPVLVHHFYERGCLSERDGLEWKVMQGDLIGAFISQKLINATEISNDTLSNIKRNDNIEALFPSRILVNNTKHISAFYVINSTDKELDELKTFSSAEMVAVPESLNLEVGLEESQLVVITISIIAVVTFSVIVLILIVLLVYRLRKRKSDSKSRVLSTPFPTPIGGGVETTVNGKTNPGYEMDGVDFHGYQNQVPLGLCGERDYDEPYFEPANKEDDLLHQLQELAVPWIRKDSLR